MRDNKARFFLLLFMVLVFLFIIVWVNKINRGVVPYVDQWGLNIAEATANTGIYSLARWVTELGSRSFLIPFTIIGMFVLWLLFKSWLPTIFFAGGTLGSHLLNRWIKHLVERERPSILVEANAEGYSFPSGHAMTPMVCYGLLMFFLIRKFPNAKLPLQVFFALLIFSVGVSRVIINVHYFTDVVTGFTLGFLLLISFIYLFTFFKKIS
ncbi:phosphatase PAP2 family protein [Virgibacillus sp. W0430]|uniref:phosphatase PAP2 family protein n=1 Tax=Virgibacillus sp. W0430 TaxID=3391580 RepID=UPI003F457A7F